MHWGVVAEHVHAEPGLHACMHAKRELKQCSHEAQGELGEQQKPDWPKAEHASGGRGVLNCSMSAADGIM